MRRSADTVVVRIPSTTPGGEYALRMRGHVPPLASITIAGFREASAHEPFTDNNLVVAGGSVASIVGTRLSNALVKYFPSTGVIQELVPASHLKMYQYSIGRSYRPEIVFVQPPGSAFEAWDVSGGGKLVGTIPYRFPTALFQISDSVYVRTISTFMFSAILRDTSWTGGAALRYFNDATGAALSSKGEFGLVMFNHASGQPVFDGATGQVRYFIPLTRAYYAHFSTTEDTLFVAGVDSARANVLLAIDPQNGNEIARRVMDTGGFVGLAIDAFNNRIFVGIQHEYRIVDIHVLDARTFEPLAVMRGENPHTRLFFCAQMVFDNSGIFIVDTHSTMAFDYLP